jgi:glycosyltransferase involved in cell wall biosynthesis
MDKKIKVLHAITRLDRGGSTENTLLSAIGLAEKGYDVDILFGKTEDPEITLLSKAGKAGIGFIEEEDLVRNIHPLKDLTALWETYRLIRENKYDIVHAHSSKAGIICRFAAKLAGVKKIVYTPHGHVFYGYFGKFLTRCIIFAEAMAARITSRIIGLTPAECDEWIRFGIGSPVQYAAIPSGLDFSLMQEGKHDKRNFKQELGIKSGDILVGSVGRFVEIKGYEYLIEAARDIVKERGDIHFLLAGEGPLRKKYKEMIASLGLKDRFHIIGWKDNTYDVIRSMDIFVLPSLKEGMGRVLIQAMFLGVSVVATRVGGVPSVVGDGTGIMVPPESPKAIARAIREILEDPVRRARMAEKAMERVITGYSSREMVEKLDRLYRELLNEKRQDRRRKREGGK